MGMGDRVPVDDGDAVRLSGGFVGGGDVQVTVGVDIEGNLNLRNTTGSRGDVGERELAENVIVLGAGTLTLVNLDEYARLVVGIGGENLGFPLGDGSISLDEGSHDTTSGLDTEGERSNVEQDQVPNLLRGVTGENGGLDGGTVSNGLVGVDARVGLFSIEEVGDELNDRWDTGGTTDQTISWTSALSTLESRRTFSTGSRVLRKRSWHNSSKRARVREV
jgi:hypothetical protein